MKYENSYVLKEKRFLLIPYIKINYNNNKYYSNNSDINYMQHNFRVSEMKKL